MGDISIERGVTGFIVYDNTGQGLLGKKWAFETPQTLAEFIISWCETTDDKDAK